MVIILGNNELSYDHFGDWNKVIDAELEATTVTLGDTSVLGEQLPGTANPGEIERTVTFQIEAE